MTGRGFSLYYAYVIFSLCHFHSRAYLSAGELTLPDQATPSEAQEQQQPGFSKVICEPC